MGRFDYFGDAGRLDAAAAGYSTGSPMAVARPQEIRFMSNNDASAPVHWRIVATLLYIFAPLTLYPTLLLLIDGGVSLHRYFEPPETMRLSLVYLLLALGFIFPLMLVQGMVIAREAKVKFIAISTVLAFVTYAAGSFVYALWLGQNSAEELTPASHAVIMFAGFVISMFYSEALIFRLFGQNPLGIRPQKTWVNDPIVFGSFILAPMLGYPFLMVVAEALPDLSHLRMSRVSEPTHMPLFGYVSQLTALGFVLVYGAVLTFAFVRTKRLAFFGAASAGAYVLYNLGVKFQVIVDELMSAPFMRACDSSDLTSCLGFFEHGGLIGLSVIISGIVVGLAFKYLGRVDPFEMPR
jgi:hypothetical protein